MRSSHNIAPLLLPVLAVCCSCVMQAVAQEAPTAQQPLSSAPLSAPATADADSATPQLEEQARLLVERKEFERARKIYGQLLASHPANIEYRLAFARISGWLKDYDAASVSYDHVLGQQPDNVDALVGKAYVLMWQGKYSLARPLLDRARELAPRNVDADLAIARWHHYQGQTQEARQALDRLLALDPDNVEAQQLAAQIEQPRPYELSVGYERFRLSNAPAGGLYNLRFGHVAPRRRAGLIYQRWNRFREKDNRVGFDLSQKVGTRTWLEAGVLLAPGATVVPRQEYSLGASTALTGRLIGRLTYRYVRFAGASSHIVGPSIEYYLRNGDWLQFAVYKSWTSFTDPPGPDDSNTSYAIRYNRQFNESLLGFVTYARGNESNVLSIDRLAALRAESFGAGLRWRISPPYTLDIYGVRQKRSDDSRENVLGAALTTRW